MILNICLSLVIVLQSRVIGRDGFIKDQNENLVEFPPKILPSFDSNIPIGHLRPLGWQKVPDGIVDEEKTMLSPITFYQKYVSKQKPVVFRNALSNIPALNKWLTKNYLKDKFSKIDVDVVVKKANFKKEPRRMKFGKFLKDYLYEDLYLSNYVPQKMMSDLVLPKCLNCGFDKWLMESELWMSSGGTSSLLHSHADHDVHCMISGRKDFIFIEQKYKSVFKYHEKDNFPGAGYSDIDMDQINMFKYKEIGNVPWTWSTLKHGDCVFVPAGYLHQVRSYGISISYTNHFAPSPDLDLSQCSENNNEEYLLNEKQFLWSYSNGKLLLANDNLDAQSSRKVLLMVIRNQTSINRTLFEILYKEVMAEAVSYPPVDEMWSLLTSYQGEVLQSIPRSDIHSMPYDILNKLAQVLNLPHKQQQTVATKKEEL